jgi:ribosomal protein S18 acetylase RimI-like enzyme
MSAEDFHRFPRHPDWKHEYWDGVLHLTYRQRVLRLVRDVAAPVVVRRRHAVRLVDELPAAFLADVWREEEPVSVLAAELREPWLERELADSAGRLLDNGVAVAEEDGELIGAVAVEQPSEHDPGPVLTWLSVRRGYRHDGVATALLDAVLASLRASGVEHLTSGAAAGNPASVAWHWRNGFTLIPDPLVRHALHARRRD